MVGIPQKNLYSITLSSKELIFLCSLIGAENIIGIDDPFITYTHEELDREFEEIKEALEYKKLIKSLDDGTIRIDDNVLAVVNTCCSSKTHVIIEKSSKSLMERFVFYSTFHSVLALNISGLSENLLLRFIATTEDVKREIYSLIPANIPDDTEESMLFPSINSLEFENFLNHKDIKYLQKSLQDSAISDDKANLIINTLLNPIQKISMICLEQDEYDRFDGNGILIFEGTDGSILTMASEKGDEVNIYSFCNHSATKAIDKVMHGISKTHLYKNHNILNFVGELLYPIDE